MRLAINALQGVESALVSINKICTLFFSDPADRTYHRIPSLWNRTLSTVALGRILKTICRSGYIVYQLLRFVDYFKIIEFNKDIREQNGLKFDENALREAGERPLYSLVNQAFAVSVGKILEGYTSALDTLHASATMRRSLKTFDMSSCASPGVGLLTSVAHSEVTLLEVYLHTEGLRTQIEALGNICNIHDVDLCLSASCSEELGSERKFTDFPIGGDLLTYLYIQLKVCLFQIFHVAFNVFCMCTNLTSILNTVRFSTSFIYIQVKVMFTEVELPNVWEKNTRLCEEYVVLM